MLPNVSESMYDSLCLLGREKERLGEKQRDRANDIQLLVAAVVMVLSIHLDWVSSPSVITTSRMTSSSQSAATALKCNS